MKHLYFPIHKQRHLLNTVNCTCVISAVIARSLTISLLIVIVNRIRVTFRFRSRIQLLGKLTELSTGILIIISHTCLWVDYTHIQFVTICEYTQLDYDGYFVNVDMYTVHI